MVVVLVDVAFKGLIDNMDADDKLFTFLSVANNVEPSTVNVDNICIDCC